MRVDAGSCSTWRAFPVVARQGNWVASLAAPSNTSGAAGEAASGHGRRLLSHWFQARSVGPLRSAAPICPRATQLPLGLGRRLSVHRARPGLGAHYTPVRGIAQVSLGAPRLTCLNPVGGGVPPRADVLLMRRLQAGSGQKRSCLMCAVKVVLSVPEKGGHTRPARRAHFFMCKRSCRERGGCGGGGGVHARMVAKPRQGASAQRRRPALELKACALPRAAHAGIAVARGHRYEGDN